jgi:hypothetical protein
MRVNIYKTTTHGWADNDSEGPFLGLPNKNHDPLFGKSASLKLSETSPLSGL